MGVYGQLTKKKLFGEIKMSNVIIAVGIRSSGKSTYAKNLVAKDSSYVEVSRDLIRRKLFNVEGWSNYNASKENEKLVTAEQFSQFQKAVADNKNIIISDMNIRMTTINGYVDYFKKLGCSVSIKLFKVTMVEVLRRCENNSSPVNIEELVRQMRQFEKTCNLVTKRHPGLLIS